MRATTNRRQDHLGRGPDRPRQAYLRARKERDCEGEKHRKDRQLYTEVGQGCAGVAEAGLKIKGLQDLTMAQTEAGKIDQLKSNKIRQH